ncbi:MAG: DegV family protein [Terrisporobacter othiniensis]|uniref:DegV family protein n=1 Tax=Terrisporobacter othiniensis TaxID=1577792 RepID=UPI002A758772|nr:DegV family protein [Terrisporobacter othiniensis]MDY3373255.1 DegV family protein [Terrisporobacter othiniensis]
MKKIKIITDSSCDLNKDIIEKYNINIVPLNVSFGENTYIDGELDKSEFYERMRNSKELPKTSCPSPDKFMQSYEGDEDVIIFTIASALSGTYSAALLAKNMMLEENPNKKIAVIDTETGSIAQGQFIIKAAKLVEEGKTFEEVIDEIEKLKKDKFFYGSLETLENAIKGGRVNPLAGKLINALNMKVIIKVGDGEVKPIDSARGCNNSIKKVAGKISDMISNGNYTSLAIAHANCLEKAEKAKEIILKNHDFEEIIITEIGSVMGTYTSEGAILVSVL